MTRPLFEPSTPRQVAGLAWGEDQLQRRPPIPSASLNLPWAWVGEQTLTVPSSGYAGATQVDFDPAAGYGFFTNDTSTFENVVITGGYHGITCMRDGVYVGWGAVGLSRNTALTHGTKRAWIILNPPALGTLAAFDIGVTVGYNYNSAGTIDASPASWTLFNMLLSNLDGSESVPDQTTWSMLVAQESGGNATALPALFVIRIADGLPGGIS